MENNCDKQNCYKIKINHLRSTIIRTLSGLIGPESILLDAPYYNNIGDVLIWRGIEDFLSSQGKKNIGTSSGCTLQYPYLDENVTILLMGGGNFGDLWRWFQEIRLKIIEWYPHNRIVMFPQSVWYDNEELIITDAKLMSQHKDLHLCARDKWSYEFLKMHFSQNNIYLVPDMAFCIDDSFLNPFRGKESNKRLYFRRIDKEITDSTPLKLPFDCDIRDWPTIEHRPLRFFLIEKIMGVLRHLKNINKIWEIGNNSIDLYANHFIKESLVRKGCKFLSPYSSVTTTRLHAMILSVLLYKPVEYIDNTTGKLSAFANTWLNDLDIVKAHV